MKTRARSLVWIVILCSMGCEAEQDLGHECLPDQPDGGAHEGAAGGSGAVPADHIDPPYVGRPLGSERIGYRAGCTERLDPCSSPDNLENCFNPFYSGDAGALDLEDTHGPCACYLPKE